MVQLWGKIEKRKLQDIEIKYLAILGVMRLGL